MTDHRCVQIYSPRPGVFQWDELSLLIRASTDMALLICCISIMSVQQAQEKLDGAHLPSKSYRTGSQNRTSPSLSLAFQHRRLPCCG